MAVVQNKATDSGDVIEIFTNVPIVGVNALSSFVDETNEDSEKYFEKYFRYSLNGTSYSDWLPLDNANLSTINITATDVIYLQYRYVRTGMLTGDLTWNSLTLSGSGSYPEEPEKFKNSPFAQFFSSLDVRVLGWAINVLEKLYEKGIVPEFVERRKGGDDSDFISVYKPTTIFFAYLVELARAFEFFKNDPVLANKYILSRGGFTCGEETLDQLIILIMNMMRVRSQRGTINMFRPENDAFPVDGELLRLICWDHDDYFKYGQASPGYGGWYLDRTSPEFRSLDGRRDLDSSYEQSSDMADKTKYPLRLPDNISNVQDGVRTVMSISGVPANDYSGIVGTDLDFLIPIDHTISFEISFYIKQSVNEGNISFGAMAYNDLKQHIGCNDPNDSTLNRDSFFQKRSLSKVGEYYFVRGVIFASQTPDMPAPRLNIGHGTALRFKPNCKFIVPFLFLDNRDIGSVSSELKIYGLSINPVSTPYPRNYLDNTSWVDVFMKNRNGSYSSEDLYLIFRKYFVSYGSSFGFVNTGI